MPAITSGTKVLVTGASGFIAVWIVKTLLEQGFYVRGTVRSEDKGEYLVNLFKDHPGRFEYVIVEDIAKEGAFDEAVKGIDAVEHTASPFHFNVDDPDELIIPAVRGTLGILESALKYGPNIQRIVITSSVAAVIEPIATDRPRTYTEEDWNNYSTREVQEKGKEADSVDVYRASKALAEQAAWDFVNKHKGSIKWDITIINPPIVLGPPIHQVATPSALNTSVAGFHAVIKGQQPPNLNPGYWVDVRDVAEAHVKALTIDKAGGERFIVAGGPYTTQHYLDAVHSGSADPEFVDIPKGRPNEGKSFVFPASLDTTKAQTVLGMQFTTLEKSAKDTAKDLLARGW